VSGLVARLPGIGTVGMESVFCISRFFGSCYLADEWSGTRLSEGQLPPFGSYSYMVVKRSGAQCQLAILLARVNCVD